MKAFARLFPLLVAASLPVAAGRIEVTNSTLASVHPGAKLEVHFGTGSYETAPSQVSVQVIAQLEPWFAAAALPSGTGSYYDGLLFEGWLVSRDGSFSVPLYQDAAFQLGLPLGTLLFTPGTYISGSGAEMNVAVLTATVQLDEATAAALFGDNLDSYNNAAWFLFHNLGANLTVGLGPGYTVRNSITTQVGDAERTVSGITGLVTVANPEPATWAMFGGALLLLGAARKLAHRRNAR